MDFRDRRDLYNGFGNGLARAFELVVTPLLFALLGWLVDRALGTGPFIAIALGAFGLAGVAVRSYYQYAARMDALEAALPGHRVGPALDLDRAFDREGGR